MYIITIKFCTDQRWLILYAGTKVTRKCIYGYRAVSENVPKSAGQVSCQGLATEAMPPGLTGAFNPITFAISDH